MFAVKFKLLMTSKRLDFEGENKHFDFYRVETSGSNENWRDMIFDLAN
jgi:hypothetical protein